MREGERETNYYLKLEKEKYTKTRKENKPYLCPSSVFRIHRGSYTDRQKVREKEVLMAKNNGGRRDRDGGGINMDGLVAVAIDKDKSSQNALKWAVENLLHKGQTIVLVHVKPRVSSTNSNSAKMSQISSDLSLVYGDPEDSYKQLFLPFRCLCSRKDIQCKDVVLEESDVAKALVEYANQVIIEVLVVGASSSKGGFLRFNKAPDIPGTITKTAPDFCTVYVITKGKLSTKRIASRAAPSVSPLQVQLLQTSLKPPPPLPTLTRVAERKSFDCQNRRSVDGQSVPFRSRRRLNGRSYGELSMPDSEISFINSGRPSIERCSEPNRTPPRLSNLSDFDYVGFESMAYDRSLLDLSSPTAFSTGEFENERLSSASQGVDEVEAEMRRLKLELKQTMDMYSTACKEALTATKKAKELERWKLEEERKLEEAKLAEEAALAIAEKERAKSKAAIEAAEAAQRIAEIESQKRANAELKALKESEERTKAVNHLAHTDMYSSTNNQTSSPR